MGALGYKWLMWSMAACRSGVSAALYTLLDFSSRPPQPLPGRRGLQYQGCGHLGGNLLNDDGGCGQVSVVS